MNTRYLDSYLAGLFDGEGCISAGCHKAKSSKYLNFYLKLQVAMIDKKPLKLFKKQFGGNIIIQKQRPTPLYFWYASNIKLMSKILNTFLPYLIVKYDQAIVALDFMQVQKIRLLEHRYFTDDERILQEMLYQTICSLKHMHKRI